MALRGGQQDVFAFGFDRHDTLMLAKYDSGGDGSDTQGSTQFTGVEAYFLQLTVPAQGTVCNS